MMYHNAIKNFELSAQIINWDIGDIKFAKSHRGAVWTRHQCHKDSHKIGFLGIPKNASSVLRHQLKLTQFASMHKIPSNYFIFTIIREPISRFVSAYIEIVQKCTNHPEGRYHILEGITQDKIEFLDDLMANGDDHTRFAIYLDKIQYEWGFFEGHCIPQIIYLTDEKTNNLQPVYIFKINNLEPLEKLLTTQSILKVNLDPRGGSEWTNNTTSNPSLKQKLLDYIAANPKIKLQIEKLYEYDLAIWNSEISNIGI